MWLFYCVGLYTFGFCNLCVGVNVDIVLFERVYVGFVMCRCVCVWPFLMCRIACALVCVGVGCEMCGCVYVWVFNVCVYVNILMCGLLYVWVL